MKPEIDIAFDIDGVFADIEAILQEEILEKYNYDISTKTTYYITIPGVKKEKHSEIVYDILKRRIETAPIYEHSVESLETLYEFINYKPIPFVTARDPNILQEQTANWMKKTFPNIKTQIFYCPSSKKAEFLKENNFMTFVEDRFKNANRISKMISSCILINRRWNIGREENWNVIRVVDVSEAIQRYITSKSGGKGIYDVECPRIPSGKVA